MATLTELQALLTSYETARDNILDAGQSYGDAGGRNYSAARLETIERQIRRLEHRIKLVQNSNRVHTSEVIFRG